MKLLTGMLILYTVINFTLSIKPSPAQFLNTLDDRIYFSALLK